VAHQVVGVGGDYVGLRDVGAQFGDGASVGEGLEFLCLHQRAVQVEEHGGDHADTSSAE